ncbi:MAG: FAD-binding protein [Firmicutes bacterium]|nr:FAD-binding protein [Bacillota bacterium]
MPDERRLPADLIHALEEIVGARFVRTTIEERALYAYDATIRRSLPDAVVRPKTTQEIAALLPICGAHHIPVVPRGAASGLSGGSVPLRGGIALDLTRMDAILEISPQDLLAVAQAGVNTQRFADAVAAQGLFFPPDPSSALASTLGGNAAENAGGPHAFKYGVFRDYVLGLTVVTADGRILHTGGRTVKNVSGYDLTRLFVGSEGTLGVITELTLKLIPKPQAKRTLLTAYDRIEDAAETVSAIIAAGMQPAALEFLDDASMRVVESYLHLGLPVDAQALLLLEVDGPAVAVTEQAEALIALCRTHHSREVEVAQTPQQAEQLWRARKSISSAVARIKPSKISEDATVPPSKLPEMVHRLQEIGRKYEVDLVIFGHAGDGNLHPNIMCDERDAQEMTRVWQAVAEIFATTLDLGGTLSGEHGIGYMKAPFMAWEHAPAELDAMRAVKRAFDPLSILNPGKLFPEDVPPWPVPLPTYPRTPPSA